MLNKLSFLSCNDYAKKKTMALIQEIWEVQHEKRAQGLLMNLNEKKEKEKI